MSVPQNVRVSVARTWRFATSAGSAAVATDGTGYRQQLNTLKSGSPITGFGLPWPPYRSTLWAYLFGDAYQNTRTRLLVGALLPLFADGMIEEATLKAPSGGQAAVLYSCEAFLHPFAVTTILHLSLESWQAENQAARLLDGLLRHPLPDKTPGQVRDGIPLALFPRLSCQDVDGQSASFEPVGGFLVLSGLHTEADPGTLAYRLASLYQKSATDKSRPMNSDRSAISMTGRHVGMLLPRDMVRAESRIVCLHHNVATLLAYLENLATLLPAQTTQASKWFQDRAALMTNYFYRREPLPEINHIYKTRVAEMWIDHCGLAHAVNSVNTRMQPPPPALPE
jgi:hypothetical protein